MKMHALSLACALGMACLAVPVFGQDAVAAANDGAAVQPEAQPWRFEARALNMTEMINEARGGNAVGAPVPLANVDIDVTIDVPGGGDVTMTTRTDERGTFVLAGAEPAAGATLMFWVGGQQIGADKAGFLGRPVHLSDAAPAPVVDFYEVARDSHDIVLTQVIHVVSVVNLDFDDPDGPKEIMYRNTAMLDNRGPRVWIGDPEDDDGITYAVETPDGFELRNATVDNQRVPTPKESVGHSGGTGFAYRAPIFPSLDGGTVFQVMLAAPYKKGREYDASWHSEFVVARYMLNIQDDAFTYVPPSGADTGNGLADGGMNPPMGNTKVITHMWGLSSVPQHGNLSVKFLAGRPFPWRAVAAVGAMVLLALGAGALGLAVSRAGQSNAREVAVAEAHVRVPADAAARTRELDLLDRRLRRGEITSVEHKIRRAAIDAASAAESAAAPQAPMPEKSATKRGPSAALLTDVEAIASRSADADEAQLRSDVTTLARAVRELLERQ